MSDVLKKFTAILLLPFLLAALISCGMNRNYEDPSGPVYTGNYSESTPPFDGTLKVVTWNLRYGNEVDEAIRTMSEEEELQDADVVLLQEMDELGVEQIAYALSYNYVFYPSIFRTRQGKLQGNAILSKWPVVEHSKIILPKFIPQFLQTRIAVKGTILVDGIEIDVYSVHLETVWLLPFARDNQANFLINHIDPSKYSIVGGDYNSWHDSVIKYLENQYNQIGLDRVTAGTGYTFEKMGIRLTLDHIFANLDVLETGIWRKTAASDHFPVWVKMQQVE